jgi:hypothetical protein
MPGQARTYVTRMRLPCEQRRYGAPDGYWFKSIRRNQSFFSLNHFRKPRKHLNL